MANHPPPSTSHIKTRTITPFFGIPTDEVCLNVLFHRTSDATSITQALIANPAVKKITFTGSTAVGSLIAQEAGKHLKPVLLELGGKGNCVVLDDADLGKAAQAALIGAFMHV
jgi:acyl-CoA reductase-like NAD-dependent aldehyde dehydrogenase